MITIPVQTGLRCELVDITPQLQGLIHKNAFVDGVLVVFCPHTTAGLTINEGADPDVKRDILATLERLVPDDGDYHHAEGNSDAHVKASLMGSNISILIENGKMQLGTWQTAYFCEFDGPRSRKVMVTFLPGK
jgi:secondary thiamine-phosphate synthase enzyme